jgi:DNA-binding XRE family transcriptional regulator
MNALPQPTVELVESVRADLPRLRALRAGAHLSLAEVGRRVGVSESAVSHWEAGRRSPSGLTASALRVLIDDLVRGCTCGEPDIAGVTHRLDGPCYLGAPETVEG